MVSIAFYFFSAIIICLVTFVFLIFSPLEKRQRLFWFPFAILIFQLLIAIIGSTGFYIDFNVPPRLLYAGIIPSFILLATFSFSRTGNYFVQSIPVHLPIFFQSFRILVELFIYWVFLIGWGPEEATMMGYNYEFYFGITAIFFGIFVLKNKASKGLIIAWNVLGIIMLIVIVGIFFTSALAWDTFWKKSIPMISNEMLQMPAMSIATLYMPLAFWSHIFSIRQMLQNRQ